MRSRATPADTRPLDCAHCGRSTIGEVAGIVIWDGFDRIEDTPIAPPTEYVLLSCGACGLASVQIREDYGPGFDEDEPAVVYPPPKRLSYAIPTPLKREWEEAERCFRNKAYTATVVMVRRTLEGTCADSGSTQRTLHGALGDLQRRGLIEGPLATWAEALRVLGNQGAHFTGEPVTREDALDALDFAEALLDHIYVFRKRFDSFVARRAAAHESPS